MVIFIILVCSFIVFQVAVVVVAATHEGMGATNVAEVYFVVCSGYLHQQLIHGLST